MSTNTKLFEFMTISDGLRNMHRAV